jgi:hypothetical protein
MILPSDSALHVPLWISSHVSSGKQTCGVVAELAGALSVPLPVTHQQLCGQQGSSVAATALTTGWHALGELGFASPRPLRSVLFHRDSLQPSISDRRWISNQPPLHTGPGEVIVGHDGFSSWSDEHFNFLGFLCLGPQRSNDPHELMRRTKIRTDFYSHHTILFGQNVFKG